MENNQTKKSLEEIQKLGMTSSNLRSLASKYANETEKIIEKEVDFSKKTEIESRTEILDGLIAAAKKYSTEYLDAYEVVWQEGPENPAWKTLCEYVSYKEELSWISQQLDEIPSGEALLNKYNAYINAKAR